MVRELRGARFLWNRARRVTRRLDSIRFQGNGRVAAITSRVIAGERWIPVRG